MTTYKAVLFSPDGEDWVTDHRGCETVEQVWEAVANQGSRWYFYPIPAVIRDNGALTTSAQRIIAGPEHFEFLTGRTIRTAGRLIAEESELVEALLS
jgi:hypothetical protein